MNKRTLSLAMSIASFGVVAMSSAQQIVVPGPVDFGGPIGSSLNTVLTGQSPVTTAFVMGSGITVNGGELTEVNTGTFATEATIRMENDAYPGIFYATDLTAATGYTGTYICVAGTVRPWTTNGGNGGTIPVGSAWNLEFYETFDDGGVGVDETGANIDYTINQPPSPPTNTDLGTVTEGNPLVATINSLAAGEVAWYKFTLASDVNAASDQWLSIWTGESTLDTEIGLYRPDGTLANSDDNSGAGNLSAFLYGIMPGDPSSGYDIGTPDATLLTAGTYYLAVAEFNATFAGDFGVTSTGLGGGPVSLHLSRGTVLYPFNSGLLAGPYDSAGAPGDAGNSVAALGAVAAPFTFGSTLVFSGSGAEVITTTSLSDCRLRIRSSAFPGISAEFQPTTSGALTVTVSGASCVSPGTTLADSGGNLLRGLTIPAGSTMTGEFFETFDNGPGTDSTWTNVQVKIPNGSAIAPGTPPTATDLGTLTDATLTTTLVATTAPFAGQVEWYKFTLGSAVSLPGGRFLDIWTTQPGTTGFSSDTVLCLYDANGRYLTYNDDGGGTPSLMSALSFGGGSDTPTTWTQSNADLPFNGRSGEGLPAGDYYLAVCQYAANNRGDGFAVTPPATTNGGTNVNFRTNLPSSNQTLSGNLILGDTAFSGASTRNIAYTVMQGTTTLASGSVTASASSSALSIDVPASATGAAELVLDGSSFLKRKVALTLTGSNQAIGNATMQNGDVDGTGEVDAADIDQVIAAFGNMGDNVEDVDVSDEVDAADIDIVIANFGGMDD